MRPATRSVLARAAVLCVAGAMGGLVKHAVRPGGLSLFSFAEPVMCDGAEGEKVAATELDPSAASTLCVRDDVVIADARPARAYAEGHVAGAVHLPCTASGGAAEDALAHFTGAKTVIVYGTSTEEARPVADSLRRRHVPDVRVLRGGFDAWVKAGLACASGPCDGCKQTMR